MEPGPNSEVVERSRIDRMVEVLAYASVGSFKEALERVIVDSQDEFGVLEESLRLVINELCDARDRTDEAMRALEHSKAELEDKLNTIENQRLAIQELSTPILDIWT